MHAKSDLSKSDAPPQLAWDIATCATRGQNELLWGDYHFARDLSEALERQGQVGRVLRRGDEESDNADVVVHLRGTSPLQPRTNAQNILWIISHPNDVSRNEVFDRYDKVYAASSRWAGEMSRRWSTTILPLQQAADASRFHPVDDEEPHRANGRLLFVGNCRANGRKIVQDCLTLGERPLVYGANWEGIIPSELIGDRYLPNEDLPRAYRQARIVLNDHWEDMRLGGFVSNRIFEAASVGAAIISDEIEGLSDLFGPLVRTYDSLGSLQTALETPWINNETRAKIATKIRSSHSFDQRARRLIADALGKSSHSPGGGKE